MPAAQKRPRRPDEASSKYRIPKEEIVFLKRTIFGMETFLETLQKNKRHAQYHEVPLCWSQVAQALKDDMLDLAYVNRVLKKDVHFQSQMANLLSLWVSHQALHGGMPSQARETWQSSYLMLGDITIRKTACEWICQQMLHNASSAMSEVTFPYALDDQVAVHVPEMTDTGVHVNVTTQFVLPFSLAEVTEAAWIAEETFVTTILKVFDSNTCIAGDRMAYVRQDLLLGKDESQRIRMNVLSAMFPGQDTATFVLRTIVHDDAHPTDKKMWTMDTRMWLVLDAIGPHTTRIRNYFTMSPPMTKRGVVSTEEFARYQDLNEGGMDQRSLLRKMKERSYEQHVRQRHLWKAHLLQVLADRRAHQECE
ncbi:Aste57867_23579 [Aphanomyces stellatus]|uniref:Aste57867_23579 protein n=1 Tax=Aphanomyces stellatus TaxID=120398 RepID=A0A485LNW8_9STRA|nr:hypothetical protein As57867_023508 [Aphanomyces stellatus]VFU00224.1 Aste57867_23579 [Aphanomyces stellatus]